MVTWTRRGSALLSDRSGLTTVQSIILVVALALGAAGAVRALRGHLADKMRCTGEAIASLTPGSGPCGAVPSGVPAAPSAPAEAPVQAPPAPNPPQAAGPEGPELKDAGPLIVLPFPGTVAVSCTGFKDQKETCKSESGVRVQASGEVSIERSPTRLDDKGCAIQDLSVSAKLQVELSGKCQGTTPGGTLAIFTGAASKYKVTVSPEAAEQMSRGERLPPNPVDPTTLRPGESLELSEEFYIGHKLQPSYRALQLELGFDQGRRLSSGVKRSPTDPNKVRIFVGDSEFVRQAMSLGIDRNGIGVSIGAKHELSGGKLRAVDIDISTAEGWDAYQQFVATGRLPAPNAPGTNDPTTVETFDYSGSTRLEAKFGQFKIGGVASSSEGHRTETRHADGTVESVTSARINDVTIALRESTAPDGTTDTAYSLLLEGVDRGMIGDYERLFGVPLAASPDGNIRFDFHESDLRIIQAQAIDQLARTAEQRGLGLSREDIERALREDPSRLDRAGLKPGAPNVDHYAFELAAAKSPKDVLQVLYLLGGPGNDANTAMNELLLFGRMNQFAGRSRNGSALPGTRVSPQCGG